MTTLHLGVIDQYYSNPPKTTKSGKPRRRPAKGTASSTSTGDVAGYLENKYGVMQTFFDAKQQQIADALADAMAGELENIVMGAPPSPEPLAEGTSKIENMFKMFISSGEVEHSGIVGTPTQASLDRRAGKGRRYGTRGLTSFIDTGLYESSFKAWVVS